MEGGGGGGRGGGLAKGEPGEEEACGALVGRQLEDGEDQDDHHDDHVQVSQGVLELASYGAGGCGPGLPQLPGLHDYGGEEEEDRGTEDGQEDARSGSSLLPVVFVHEEGPQVGVQGDGVEEGLGHEITRVGDEDKPTKYCVDKLVVHVVECCWLENRNDKNQYYKAEVQSCYYCCSYCVTLRVPPLDSEMGWTGEIWSNCVALILKKRIAFFLKIFV